MTRVNLVAPIELTDQHLFSEWREIKMIPAALARALRTRAVADIVKGIPREFTLGKGHVTFFYDKGAYLLSRYDALTLELVVRGYRIRPDAEFDPRGVFNAYGRFNGDYEPTPAAIQIIRDRIAEKIARRREWYRYYGKPLDPKKFAK